MSPKNTESSLVPVIAPAAVSKETHAEPQGSSRRKFLAALGASSYARVLGANDRVQVGFIGYGLIGAQHVHDFKNQTDVDMAAISETYQPRMEQGAAAMGGSPKLYKDFRKLLDDKSIQAVVISTPDHWHALMCMMACAAGKDVYVEKPMTLFIAEGQWMTKVARKHNRVVQVGTQQRSGKHYQQARELVRAGHIGKVMSARAGSARNIMPGFGTPTGPVPNDLDYDMWLGPAPKHDYLPHRSLYHFRWFWDYSGGQMTNLAAHELDIVQWVMNFKGPQAVTSTGGRFGLQDDGETPDTQDALLEYPGMTAAWSHREASAGRRLPGGLEFFGTKGSLVVNRAGFEVFPDMKVDPESLIPTFQGHPAGGPTRAGAKPEPWTEAKKVAGSANEQFDLHVRNFLDCIKTRQRTIADVEDGHHTAVACHLANISLRVGRKVRWDPEKEQVVGDREATAMLVRPYRKPWDEVLKSLLS
jgi:predicted dehydrogenase